VLAGAAVTFLGSPGSRPTGLLSIPLVTGLVLVAIPVLGTGYRFGAEMTAAGLLLLGCWAGLWAAERRVRLRAASDRATGELLWEAVCEDLARARRLLPPRGDRDRLARFDEFVLRGELAAALCELEALGQSGGVPIEYWRALVSAAGRMELVEIRERLATLSGEAADADGGAPDRGGAEAFTESWLTRPRRCAGALALCDRAPFRSNRRTWHRGAGRAQ
jgi:hypothetical protein